MTDSNPVWKKDLIEGYRSFRANGFPKQQKLYETLGTKGQSPKVMMIACADSRADPSDIFDAHPGELFVVRNVANLVPPMNQMAGNHGTSAALEFAVTALGVDAIVVMGHESCGGIKACLHGLGDTKEGFVGKWVSILNEARDTVVKSTAEASRQLEMEHEGVRQSLRNLMTFPFVRDRVEAGTLSLMGAHFSIIRGVLMFADGENQSFREVSTTA